MSDLPSNITPMHTTLDWTSIDTVLLDMDGTLLDLHFDNYFWLEHLPKRYAEHHKLDDCLRTAMYASIQPFKNPEKLKEFVAKI